MEYISWSDGRLRLLDQTRLPQETVFLQLDDYREAVKAIKEMRVRGAPAIGIVGGYAVALAAQRITSTDLQEFLQRLEIAAQEIAQARPTGVNLSWAVGRMLKTAYDATSTDAVRTALVEEAKRIHEEDIAANWRIGEFGASILENGVSVLTHCNTGSLATGGYGTALGVIRRAWQLGKLGKVYACEARPLLQGARLTAWELAQDDIPCTLIVDSAAGALMFNRKVGAVIVGADRIAANGDVVNKIGTYTLAILAKENGIPFYVAAPTSTIDKSMKSGEIVPIEERSAQEVTTFAGVRTAPQGVEVFNPSFDVTPHEYIRGILTEKGVMREPYVGIIEALTGVVHA